MEEMQKMYGGMNIPNLPKADEMFVINSSNPLVKKLLTIVDEKIKDMVCLNIIDMAKLAHDTLNGEERTAFIARNAEIMNYIID